MARWAPSSSLANNFKGWSEKSQSEDDVTGQLESLIKGLRHSSLLRLWQQNKLRRINLLEGSVRSGKTWISLVLWAFWVATMPKDGNYLMVAKTLTSLRRSCLDLLQELVSTKYFTYSLSKKRAGCLAS
jgi:hypothetical protein|nr:MAG TPA: large terminase [Caudoviricetes sp.]